MKRGLINRLLATTSLTIIAGTVLVFCQNGFAAVTPNSVVTPQTVVAVPIASSGITSVVLAPSSANGSKCVGLTAYNVSAAASVTLAITSNTSTAFPLSVTSIVSGSVPTNLFASANLPLPVDNTGTPYLLINPGTYGLTVSAVASATAANITFFPICGAF